MHNRYAKQNKITILSVNYAKRLRRQIMQNISNDIYVSTDGHDENPGTLEQPFATLSRAKLAIYQKHKKASSPVKSCYSRWHILSGRAAYLQRQRFGRTRSTDHLYNFSWRTSNHQRREKAELSVDAVPGWYLDVRAARSKRRKFEFYSAICQWETTGSGALPKL